MARIKRAVNSKKKRRTLQEATKGYIGTGSRTLRGMKERSQHAGQYAYRDRRNKKRDFRSLWIQRINAAARMNDLSYSQFMHGLKLAGIELDRKVLAQIAFEDDASFADLAAVAKKAIEASQ
jgi:large subunit ribosomal protein L20